MKDPEPELPRAYVVRFVVAMTVLPPLVGLLGYGVAKWVHG